MPRNRIARRVFYVFLAFAAGFWLSRDLWRMVFHLPSEVIPYVVFVAFALIAGAVWLRFLIWRDDKDIEISNINREMEILKDAGRQSKESGKTGED